MRLNNSGAAGQPLFHRVQIHAIALLKSQRKFNDIRLQGPRCFQICRVIGLCNHDAIARLQQRCSNQEERAGSSRGNQHIFRSQPVSFGSDASAQLRQATMRRIGQKQIGQVHTKFAQLQIAYRTF